MGSQALIGLGLADGPAGISATTGLAELPDIEAATLNYAQSCYICKAPYRELHAFYAALCPSCAALNWSKRDEAVDLTPTPTPGPDPSPDPSPDPNPSPKPKPTPTPNPHPNPNPNPNTKP